MGYNNGLSGVLRGSRVEKIDQIYFLLQGSIFDLFSRGSYMYHCSNKNNVHVLALSIIRIAMSELEHRSKRARTLPRVYPRGGTIVDALLEYAVYICIGSRGVDSRMFAYCL